MGDSGAVRTTGTTRRAVLRAGLVLAAGATGTAACSGGSSAPEPRPPSADDLVREAVRTTVAALTSAYQVAIAAVPDLVAPAGSLLAEHRAHLAALGAGPSPTTSTSAGTPAPAGSPVPTPPASVAEALDRLVPLESAAARANAAQSANASGPLARLVASIASCEAAHAAVLRSRR